jgi:uncharacterized protein (DUF2141 family)
MVVDFYRKSYCIIVSFIFFLIAIVIPNKGFAVDLEVTVKALRNDKGQLRMAIFNDPGEFPRGNEIRSLDIQAKSGDVTVLFKGIKLGTYALAIHHDENLNNEMDTNFVGMPNEGYGFSNDARVFLAPPTFEAASFVIDGKLEKISLSIVY